MMNNHGIHLCPSEMEGVGANIVEALSTGAIVITTNAPPMNEIVTPDVGIILECEEAYRQYRGTGYLIKDSTLESAIQDTFLFSEHDFAELSQRSIDSYLGLKRMFKNNAKVVFC